MSTSVRGALTSRTGRWCVYILVFFWTIPTFGTLVSSFRPELQVKTTGWWTFFTHWGFTLDNYKRVLSSEPGEDNMGHFFLNSVRITVPAVILSVGIALVAAYAFSWMKFKGRDWLFVAVVSLLMVPLQMALVPLLRFFTGGAHIGSITIFPDLGLANTIPAVWIAHICFGLPFCIFILYNFVSRLPSEIIEAARVDGAGHATVFLRLVVPLSVPAIASLCIFQFMYIWNDYLVGKVFGGAGDNVPVVAKLAEVSGTRGQSWHLLTASGMIAMVVPVCVFFALQRYFVRGLLAGAVKG
jgi:alpha-glucoside transport system permease protein